MKASHDDRRQRRTRQILREALLALLRDHDYAAITVQDIVDRAEVSRSTFYAHYLDKDDLLTGQRGIFAGGLHHPLPDAPPATAPQAPTLSARRWFQHLLAHRATLKQIAKNSAMSLAMKNFSGMVRADLKRQSAAYLARQLGGPLPAGLVVEYLASTLMTLIQWWIENDMPQTPEQMDQMFLALVGPSLESVGG